MVTVCAAALSVLLLPGRKTYGRIEDEAASAALASVSSWPRVVKCKWITGHWHQLQPRRGPTGFERLIKVKKGFGVLDIFGTLFVARAKPGACPRYRGGQAARRTGNTSHVSCGVEVVRATV